MAVTDSFAPAASITLIAPGMGAALRQSVGSIGEKGAVSLLAGRGGVKQAWDRRELHEASLQTWQRGLLAVLGLESRQFASGPISARGDALLVTDREEMSKDYWLHGDLVHLAAGLDRLTFLQLTGPAAVTVAEREGLAPLISGHLQNSPLRLRTGAKGQWFLHSSRPLDLQTASPDAATANELEAVMPSGAAAGELRRVMTECQMLLHDHDVNERRQRRGLPTINSLWPWGGGVLMPQSPRSLPQMFADDEFSRGIYRLHSLDVESAPPNASALLQRATLSKPVVAVIAAESPAVLESEWIDPLVTALRAGRIRRVDLVLDEWHIHATRGMLRSFWRKPLPVSAWPMST